MLLLECRGIFGWGLAPGPPLEVKIFCTKIECEKNVVLNFEHLLKMYT